MKTLFITLLLALIAYLVWPFTTLYQLDQALQQSDRARLAELVDLQTVRAEINRKMNKEMESSIGEVSGSFVEWLQSGIQRLGSGAIDQMVDLEWAMHQLRSHNPDPRQGGLLNQLDYAFFDGPNSLLLRIGELGENPVHARLTRDGERWRITAIYN
ncbi:DUF2939 domain-containing protein [endosymbiont of Ridgeia piscesae]|jgi:hypothetical protein|uniref:DUF2939 domain-containing protein n=1 Tax=endosymbiont of Ridgeia piscesae TaxID=54398 RepID=A0A0T5YTM1_9GAMM|nr:DUF2939 domain-containing protein [endosymbiont of Ridgeia piscesae]KRT53949.1 Protein of unknown function (DUF2939) [endosymbiont of Ridgeia piscesae]KRT57298.1 Protein of unknown function (DUF2939) [endosymbiont of Ridgeia piscesae]